MFKKLIIFVKKYFSQLVKPADEKVAGRYFKEVGITLFDDERNDQIKYNDLAKNTTDEKILATLAESYSVFVRGYVACNSYSSMKTLTKLLRDDRWYVRENLTYNPKITYEMLDVLANDECMHVRRSVANNKNTSIETLKKLCQDESPYVAADAKENLANKQILYYI